MKHFAWFTGIAATCMLFACLGSELASEAVSEQGDPLVLEESEAMKIDPCALVRCRAGTQCEVHDGRPVCVRPAPEPECSSDKECRTFSNYCEGCACLALSVNEVDPVCKGQMVACFVDPCRNQTARCMAGQCVLDGAASF